MQGMEERLFFKETDMNCPTCGRAEPVYLESASWCQGCGTLLQLFGCQFTATQLDAKPIVPGLVQYLTADQPHDDPVGWLKSLLADVREMLDSVVTEECDQGERPTGETRDVLTDCEIVDLPALREALGRAEGLVTELVKLRRVEA